MTDPADALAFTVLSGGRLSIVRASVTAAAFDPALDLIRAWNLLDAKPARRSATP